MEFYFTFGTDLGFPFCGGWVEVHAKSGQEAVGKFNSKYPPRDNDVVNCAFIYPEDFFKTTKMYKEQNNLGSALHETIL